MCWYTLVCSSKTGQNELHMENCSAKSGGCEPGASPSCGQDTVAKAFPVDVQFYKVDLTSLIGTEKKERQVWQSAQGQQMNNYGTISTATMFFLAFIHCFSKISIIIIMFMRTISPAVWITGAQDLMPCHLQGTAEKQSRTPIEKDGSTGPGSALFARASLLFKTGNTTWRSPEAEKFQHTTMIALIQPLSRSRWEEGMNHSARYEKIALFWHIAITSEEINGIPHPHLSACEALISDPLSEGNPISYK